MTEFAKILKECMAKGVGLVKAGEQWTVPALAEQLGVADRTVTRWRNGKKPDPEKWPNLRMALTHTDSPPEHRELLEALIEAYDKEEPLTDKPRDAKDSQPAGNFQTSKIGLIGSLIVVLLAAVLVGFNIAGNPETVGEARGRAVDMIADVQDRNTELGKSWAAVDTELWRRTKPRGNLVSEFEELRITLEPETDEVRFQILSQNGRSIIVGKGDDPKLRTEFNDLLNFFERLNVCVAAGDCDLVTVDQAMGDDIRSFWSMFGPFILTERGIANGYGEGIEALAEAVNHPPFQGSSER